MKQQIIKGRKRSRLYTDYSLLARRGPDSPPRKIDERYQSVLSAFQRAVTLSKNDEEDYRETFNRLQATVGAGLAVTLSGHTHKRERDDDRRQYVADRFFTKKLCYADEQTGQPEAASGEAAGGTADRKLKLNLILNYGVCQLVFPSGAAGPPNVGYQFYSARFGEAPSVGEEEKLLGDISLVKD